MREQITSIPEEPVLSADSSQTPRCEQVESGRAACHDKKRMARFNEDGKIAFFFFVCPQSVPCECSHFLSLCLHCLLLADSPL